MGTLTIQHKLTGGLPGHAVDLYASATGERLATGVIDSEGDCTLEYPAFYGAAHAIVREQLAPTPWQANTAYTRGDVVTCAAFPGRLLRCALNGTSGGTEPDDSQRIKGYVHRPAHLTKGFSQAYTTAGSRTGYGYSAMYSNVGYDGDPNLHDYTQRVECQNTEYGAYTLMADGTVKFQHVYTGADQNAAYAEVQALTNIVKIWPYKHGIIALDTSDNLHHVCDNNRSAHKAVVDTLLANNPTAHRFIAGCDSGHGASVILTDGSGRSNNGTLNTYLSGLTGLEAGAMGGTTRYILLCDGSTRLRGMEQNGVLDHTSVTHLPGEAIDPIDELVMTYGGMWAVSRAGSRFKWRTHSSDWQYAGSFSAWMAGKPTEHYIGGPGWPQSETTEGVYILTRRFFTVIQKSSFGSGPRGNAQATSAWEYIVGGEPIIRDAGCTWHLIEPTVRHDPGEVRPTSYDNTTTIPVGSVSGTVAVDQAPAERPVIALAYKDGQPTVLASGASDAGGNFDLAMPGQTDPVYLLALDNAGPTWRAATPAVGGDRVIPTAAGHTGLVYECSSSGTTAATEPTWPTEIGTSIVDGSVTWEAVAYYQPQAHGPIQPVVTGTPGDILENGNTYAYLEQQTIEGVVIQVFANTLDGADLIYRRLAPPADIVGVDTESSDRWAYARTLNTGYFWADEYANTIDSDDLIYRLLDGSDITDALPLTLPVPNGSFEDDTRWITTLGSVAHKTTSQTGAHTGTRYIHGGSEYETKINQDVDFAADVGLPAWAWHGHTLAVRWQQSSYSGNDQGQVIVTFLDDQGGTLSVFQSILHAATAQVWTFNSISSPVPAGAVGINIEIYFKRQAGNVNDGYFDSMDLQLTA